MTDKRRMTEIENPAVPPSFKDVLKKGYLGSPKVVTSVLGGFLETLISLVIKTGAKEMTESEMTDKMLDESKKFALVFSGKSDDYTGVVGIHSDSVGLSQTLRVYLGQFWRDHKAEWGNDPYRVAYGWMAWAVVDALSRGGDVQSTGVIMRQRLAPMIKILSGAA